MKTVFEPAMLAHVWANRSQDNGRTSSQNYYFTGPTLYSYGNHFVVAHHVDLGNGETVVLWNNGSYSNTTARHQRYARQALTRAQWAGRLDVPTLNGGDLRGAYLPALAERCREEAATYLASAEGKRTSGVRAGLVSSAGRWLEMAARIARIAAARKGDSAMVTPLQARSLRTLAERCENVFAALRDEKESITDARLTLSREDVRREMVRAVELAWEDYNRAIGAIDAGDYLASSRRLTTAASLAKSAKARAKNGKFRAPKLPDADSLARSIAEKVKAAVVEEARNTVDYQLRQAWRMMRSDYAPGSKERTISNSYDIAATAADDAKAHGVEIDTSELARLLRRISRAHSVHYSVRNLERVAGTLQSAESYAESGYFRDAVRELNGALGIMRNAQAALPATHPAQPTQIAAVTLRRDTLALEFAREDAAKVAAWRNGERAHLSHDTGPLLRLRDNVIETSWGASVPASVAPLLWRVICNAKRGVDTSAALGMRVGHFKLDTVHADGSLTIGCHHIAYAEFERIAMQLGYVNTGVAA